MIRSFKWAMFFNAVSWIGLLCYRSSLLTTSGGLHVVMSFALTLYTSRIHIAYTLVGFVYSFEIFICITCIFVLHIYLYYIVCTTFVQPLWLISNVPDKFNWNCNKFYVVCRRASERACVCIQNISIYIFDTVFSLFLFYLSLSI